MFFERLSVSAGSRLMKSTAQDFRSLSGWLRLLWLLLLRKIGIAFGQGAARNCAYVVNMADNTVSVIHTAFNVVIATVAVGSSPRWAAITPDGAFVFVTNFGSGDLSVIDTSSDRIVNTVAISYQPLGIAITPNGAKAYVTLPKDDKVAVVNVLPAGAGVLTGFVNVGMNPGFVAITPNGKLVYVTNFKSSSVSVIDTATDQVVATLLLGPLFGGPLGPARIAITPNGEHAYVACVNVSNTVQVEINNGNKLNVKLWDPPLGQCFGVGIATVVPPATFHVYITDTLANGYVSIVADQDFSLVSSEDPQVGLNPCGVAITGDSSFAYVTCEFANQVAVIDTQSRKVVHTINVGKQPFGITI